MSVAHICSHTVLLLGELRVTMTVVDWDAQWWQGVVLKKMFRSSVRTGKDPIQLNGPHVLVSIS